MNKIPYIPISQRYHDESKHLPSLCRRCLWRTGRVCMFSVCVCDDLQPHDRIAPLQTP